MDIIVSVFKNFDSFVHLISFQKLPETSKLDLHLLIQKANMDTQNLLSKPTATG